MRVELKLTENYDPAASQKFDDLANMLQSAMLSQDQITFSIRGVPVFSFPIFRGVRRLEIDQHRLEVEGEVFLGSITKEVAK